MEKILNRSDPKEMETTRGWKEATVLRLAPCVFGLFSVVAVLYALLPVRARAAGRGPGGMAGQGRDDLLRCHHGGKRWLWVNWVFANHGFQRGLFKTPTPVPGGLAFSLGAVCVTVEKGQKTSLGLAGFLRIGVQERFHRQV